MSSWFTNSDTNRDGHIYSNVNADSDGYRHSDSNGAAYAYSYCNSYTHGDGYTYTYTYRDTNRRPCESHRNSGKYRPG